MWLGFVGFLMEGGKEATTDEEVRVLLARLKFSNEETKTIITQNKMQTTLQ